MKFSLYLVLLFCLLSPARAGIFSSPPPNEFIQYAAPDLQEKFKSDWDSEGTSTRDSGGYLVHADNPAYRRFWVAMKTYRVDLDRASREVPTHPDPELTMPQVPDYQAQVAEWQKEQSKNWKKQNDNAITTMLNTRGTRDPQAEQNTTLVVVLIGYALLFVLAVGVYFIPSVIAIVRRSPQVFAIVAVNFFLGWTLIGWGAALVLACWRFRKD